MVVFLRSYAEYSNDAASYLMGIGSTCSSRRDTSRWYYPSSHGFYGQCIQTTDESS